jgi:dTDP-4-dehydrorhamnose 3,5-epimerase-like enzyme
MQIERFNVEDIFAMIAARHGDHRGFFSETYRESFFTR